MRTCYVYMNNLVRRVYEHKQKLVDGFTKKYNVDQLVYFEEFQDIRDAILREKRVKRWKRESKIRRIEELNPAWKDLYNDLHF